MWFIVIFSVLVSLILEIIVFLLSNGRVFGYFKLIWFIVVLVLVLKLIFEGENIFVLVLSLRWILILIIVLKLFIIFF